MNINVDIAAETITGSQVMNFSLYADASSKITIGTTEFNGDITVGDFTMTRDLGFASNTGTISLGKIEGLEIDAIELVEVDGEFVKNIVQVPSIAAHTLEIKTGANLSQSDYWMVDTLSVEATSANINLTNSDNDFNTVDIKTNQNATIEDVIDVRLGSVNIDGNLTVTANDPPDTSDDLLDGSITQTGEEFNIGGNLSATAGEDIILDGFLNDISNVSVANAPGTVIINTEPLDVVAEEIIETFGLGIEDLILPIDVILKMN